MTRARTLVVCSAMAALCMPTARSEAQADVRQVCVSGLPCVDMPNIPMLRRGVKQHVKFKGALIDLVEPFNLLSNRSSVTVAFIRRYSCDGVGCVEAYVTVSPDFSLTDKVQFEFLGGITTGFSSGKVSMSAIRGGQITGITQSPAPGTWGQPVNVTLTGRDIGNAKVVPSSGTVSNVESQFDRITFKHTPGGTATTAVSYRVSDMGLPIGDWRFGYLATGNAAVHNLVVDYRPVTSTASCVASTSPTVPQPTSPAAGSMLAFSNDPVKATVSLVWTGALAAAGSSTATPDTRYEYEVVADYPAVTLSGVTRATSTTSPVTSAVPLSARGATTAKSVSVTLSRNQAYKWRVRATQCATTSAPTTGSYSTYSTFTVK